MKELDVVKLQTAYAGLAAGTEGTIVCEYDGDYCEVEYFDDAGNTIDVVTTPISVLTLPQTH